MSEHALEISDNTPLGENIPESSLERISASIESIEDLLEEYLDNDNVLFIEGILFSHDELGNPFFILPRGYDGPFPPAINKVLRQIQKDIDNETEVNQEEIKKLRRRYHSVRFIYDNVKALNDVLISLTNIMRNIDYRRDDYFLTDDTIPFSRPRMMDGLIEADKICRQLRRHRKSFERFNQDLYLPDEEAWDKVDRIIKIVSDEIDDEEINEVGFNWEEFILISTEIMVGNVENRKDLKKLEVRDVRMIFERLKSARTIVEEDGTFDWINRFNLMKESARRSIHQRIAHLSFLQDSILNSKPKNNPIFLEREIKRLKSYGEEVRMWRNLEKEFLSIKVPIPEDKEMAVRIISISQSLSKTTRTKTLWRSYYEYDLLTRMIESHNYTDLTSHSEELRSRIIDAVSQKIDHLKLKQQRDRQKYGGRSIDKRPKGTIRKDEIEDLEYLLQNIMDTFGIDYKEQ